MSHLEYFSLKTPLTEVQGHRKNSDRPHANQKFAPLIKSKSI